MSPIYIISINGITLWLALFLTLCGREAYCLCANFAFVPTRRVLRRFYEILLRRRLLVDLYDGMPSVRHIRDIPQYQDRDDIFLRAEATLNTRFGFARIDRYFPDFGIALKHAACTYIRDLLPHPCAVHALARNFPQRRIRVIGDEVTLGVLEGAFAPQSNISATLSTAGRVLTNSLGLIIAAGAMTGFVARRMRLGHPQAERIHLGVDCSGRDARGVRLMYEFSDNIADVLVVYRSVRQKAFTGDFLGDIRTCLQTDGRFSIAQGFSAWVACLTGMARIMAAFHGMPAMLFFEMVKLPIRQIEFKGLFNRYRFANFLGRDDYNPEHAVRTMELRRAGAVSIGISHGLSAEELINPSNRWIDFDRYYVMSLDLWKKYYASTWPIRMQVVVTGSYGMSREQLTRLGKPRPKGMIYWGRRGPDEIKVVEALFAFARRYPDRRCFIKMKGDKSIYDSSFVEFCLSGPPNVEWIDCKEDSYELMFEASYAIGTGTTVVAESLQYGLTTFAYDYRPGQSYFYREYPGFTVTSPEDLVSRVGAIEDGAEAYDRGAYGGLIELSGQIPYDTMRADMGLAPRGLPTLH